MSRSFLPLAEVPALDFDIFTPDTAELQVGKAYVKAVKAQIAVDVLRPDFDPEATRACFPEYVDNATGTVITAALDLEVRHRDKPLHAFIGEQAVYGGTAGTMVPPDTFVDSVKQQITLPSGYFNRLKGYHDIVSETPFLTLARDVSGLEDSQTDGWAEAIYARVEDATLHHFDEYAVPVNQADALYLLCYLPDSARKMTRRLLTLSTLYGIIEQSLVGGAIPPSEDETASLAALKQYFQTEILTGQKWTDMSLRDDSMARIAALSVEQLHDLATLQTNTRKNNQQNRVGEAWETGYDHLRDLLRAVSHEDNYYHWAQTDTGHGFDGFTDHHLREVLGRDIFDTEYHEFTTTPDGTRVVILEDDPDQMRLFQAVVKRYLPQTVVPEQQFVSPDGIEATIDDPRNTLFLLDIQNGEDDTAGIRVAEQILRRRYETAQAAIIADDISDLPQTNIIIWSNSQESLRLASAFFKPIVSNLQGVSYELYGESGARSYSGNKFSLTVRPKGFNMYDLASKL